jgi:hypothetical protein
MIGRTTSVHEMTRSSSLLLLLRCVGFAYKGSELGGGSKKRAEFLG